LYERLVFIERHPETDRASYGERLLHETAKALGDHNSSPRWIDLIPLAFNPISPKTDLLIREVGFVPRELVTKKKFKSLGADAVIPAIEQLARADNQTSQFERARLINAFIISGNANERRIKNKPPVSPDANGLFLQLRGFHTHLPYGLISDDLHQTLQQGHWCANDASAAEIRERSLQENSRIQELHASRTDNAKRCADRFGIAEDAVEPARALYDELVRHPVQFAKKLIAHQELLPDLVILEAINQRRGETTLALFQCAEALGAELTQRRVTAKRGEFLSYDVMNETEEAYAAQSSIINDPRYYSSIKVVQQILRNQRYPKQDNVIYLRGLYKTGKREKKLPDQHTFFEIICDGRSARVLLNEQKHLNASDRNRLVDLGGTFSADWYEKIEGLIQYTDQFVAAIRDLHRILRVKKPDWEQHFAKQTRWIRSFLLTYRPHVVPELGRAFDDETTIAERDAEMLLEKLDEVRIELLDAQRNVFHQMPEPLGKKMYPEIFGDPLSPEKNLIPGIWDGPISYNQHFQEIVGARCAPSNIDPELCLHGGETRAVRLEQMKGQKATLSSAHMEQACFDRLRVDRRRPLIAVIGEGSEQEIPDEQAQLLREGLLSAGHRSLANINMPGHQVGLGRTIAHRVLHYKQEASSLPLRSQAHPFSICPVENTIYPDSPANEQDPNRCFALSPVDSYLSPLGAPWIDPPDQETDRKLYAEQKIGLCQRLSEGHPQIAVAAQSDLYSLFEINACLTRGFTVVFLRDGHAFGSTISHIIEEQKIGSARGASEEETAEQKILRNLPTGDTQTPDPFADRVGTDLVTVTPEQRVYREAVRTLLHLISTHRDQCVTTTTAELDTVLLKAVAKKKPEEKK
jgi:hypothetical protein